MHEFSKLKLEIIEINQQAEMLLTPNKHSEHLLFKFDIGFKILLEFDKPSYTKQTAVELLLGQYGTSGVGFEAMVHQLRAMCCDVLLGIIGQIVCKILIHFNLLTSIHQTIEFTLLIAQLIVF